MRERICKAHMIWPHNLYLFGGAFSFGTYSYTCTTSNSVLRSDPELCSRGIFAAREGIWVNQLQDKYLNPILLISPVHVNSSMMFNEILPEELKKSCGTQSQEYIVL